MPLFSRCCCLSNRNKSRKGSSVSAALPGRIVSYTLKITNRSRTVYFFREILGMKILRHNEYSECNDTSERCQGRWSKTMVGYGPEDKYFALELIYNYPIHHYDKGNDLICMKIKGGNCLKRAKKNGWPILERNQLESPDGVKFEILDESEPTKADPIISVVLAVSKLKSSLKYWHDMLGMGVIKSPNVVGYNANETTIELRQVHNPIKHGDCRLSLLLPDKEQEFLEYKLEKFGYKILVPVVTFENDLLLLLLQDPDGHELCFYNEKGYKNVAVYTPSDEGILNKMLTIEEANGIKDEPAKRVESRKMLESIRKKQVAYHRWKRSESNSMKRYYKKYQKKCSNSLIDDQDSFECSKASDDSYCDSDNSKQCNHNALISTKESPLKNSLQRCSSSPNSNPKSIAGRGSASAMKKSLHVVFSEENNEFYDKTNKKSDSKSEDKSVLVLLTSATVIYKTPLKDENVTNTDSKDNLMDQRDQSTETIRGKTIDRPKIDKTTSSKSNIKEITFNEVTRNISKHLSRSPDPSKSKLNGNYTNVYRSKSRDYAGRWIGKDIQPLKLDTKNKSRSRTQEKLDKTPFEVKKNEHQDRVFIKYVQTKSPDKKEKEGNGEKKGNYLNKMQKHKKPIETAKVHVSLKDQHRNTKQSKLLNESNLDDSVGDKPFKSSLSSEEFICLTEMNIDEERGRERKAFDEMFDGYPINNEVDQVNEITNKSVYNKPNNCKSTNNKTINNKSNENKTINGKEIDDKLKGNNTRDSNQLDYNKNPSKLSDFKVDFDLYNEFSPDESKQSSLDYLQTDKRDENIIKNKNTWDFKNSQ